MGSHELLLSILSLLAGGGLLIGIASLFKVRPERGKIIVESAGAVVVMQRNLIDDLENEVKSLKDRVMSLETEKRTLQNKVREMELHIINLESRFE